MRFTVATTSSSVAILTIASGFGAWYSLHRTSVEALNEILACFDNNGFSAVAITQLRDAKAAVEQVA